MSKRAPSLFLSIAAFVLYIVGGIATFTGIALVLLMGGRDLFGWGDAKAIGYLLVCSGLCFSVMGVLFLRLVRNRTNELLCQSVQPKQ